MSPSSPCNRNGCYCDQNCHSVNDCCSDIADIGCHPASSSSLIVSLTPTHTLGKINSLDYMPFQYSFTLFIFITKYYVIIIPYLVTDVVIVTTLYLMSNQFNCHFYIDTESKTPYHLTHSTYLLTGSSSFLSGSRVTPTPVTLGM